MAYKLAFGGFTFPATMRPNGSDSPIDLAEQERPRADGSITQTGRRKSRLVTIRGSITAADPDTLQATSDAMRAAIAPGNPGQLWLGRDDRYANAQVETWSDDTEDGMYFGVVVNISIGFRLADPFWYAASATTDALATAGGTVTTGANAPASPAWSVTIGTGGTGTVTLTNSTTGETAMLSGTFTAGDVIVIDRSAYTVTLNGASAFGLLSGRIPSLAAGANTITASASTVTISALSTTYIARYE
jgi:phage-related protein